MNSAIIMHGRPDKDDYYSPNVSSPSNFEWIPWLQKQLLMNDIKADTPEVQFAFRPRYPEWKKEFERFDVTPESILIGHSCGGGFLVRWLSENPDVKVKKVILVAPWLNPDNNPDSDTADFFEFEIAADLASRADNMIIFVSDDDEPGVQTSVQTIIEKVPGMEVRQFSGKGHFIEEHMGTTEFPELVEECLR